MNQLNKTFPCTDLLTVESSPMSLSWQDSESALIYTFFFTSSALFRRFCSQHTSQKMKFSITDFCSKCNQIRSFLRIWSHLLKKSVMENFIFCAMTVRVKQAKQYKNHVYLIWIKCLWTFQAVRSQTSKENTGNFCYWSLIT